MFFLPVQLTVGVLGSCLWLFKIKVSWIKKKNAWFCFSLNNFIDLYSTKLGFKRETLKQTLWGDYYLNAKNKMIMKNAQVFAILFK